MASAPEALSTEAMRGPPLAQLIDNNGSFDPRIRLRTRGSCVRILLGAIRAVNQGRPREVDRSHPVPKCNRASRDSTAGITEGSPMAMPTMLKETSIACLLHPFDAMLPMLSDTGGANGLARDSL